MGSFQKPITIAEAMDKISSNDYMLPAFQRYYTWKTEQIERLFDSIMKGYPISSMLFWQVTGSQSRKWNFYRFLSKYKEGFPINEEDNTKKNFLAVLDGQQRLTSLYLALRSTYEIHKKGYRWENEDKNFEKCSLYFNLTQKRNVEKKLDDVEYEFLWLKDQDTNTEVIHKDKYDQTWFLCKEIYSYNTENKIKKLGLALKETERLKLFYERIFKTKTINYYLEDEPNPDKAVDIFIRINSNGTPLEFSDILFSFAVANWENGNFREKTEILIEKLEKLDFKIKEDLILKTCLFLFEKDIRFKIDSFNKDFVKNKIEVNWDNIAECFSSVAKLLQIFGFKKHKDDDNSKSLTSKNLVIPIIYFVYHNNLSKEITESVKQENNRNLIKSWILRALVCRAFSHSSDTVLTNMRKAFTKDISKNFFDKKCLIFPQEAIEMEANYVRLNPEDIEEKLKLRKGNIETFTILSLLYPNLKKELELDKDHLHPFNICENRKLEVEKFDSIVNLQLLVSGENRAKKNKPLDIWINEQCNGGNRKKFLKEHLIPDVDLSIENFDDFYEKRKILLTEKLKEILNIK